MDLGTSWQTKICNRPPAPGKTVIWVRAYVFQKVVFMILFAKVVSIVIITNRFNILQNVLDT